MELRPFALERWFAAREFAARAHLSSSDCEALRMDEVVAGADDEARALWSGLTLGYTEARGSPRLRAEIAALYGISADDVLCAAPSECIFLAMTALLQEGDVVVVALPAYQSLFEIARSRGCTVRPWTPDVDAGGRWRFDPERLRGLVDGAKLVVVNFPHNPTGAHATPDEWRAITDIVDRAGAWLFADEMYRLLEPDVALRLPSAVEMLDRAVTLGGLSKALSAPGLRQGWLASKQRRLLEDAAMLKDYTTICGNAPGEALALMVLRDRARIVAANLARIATNADAVDDLARRRPDLLAWSRPRAGCTALARLVRAPSAALFSEALFAATGVLVMPATLFRSEGADLDDHHVRFGLGRAGFAAALGELERFAAAEAP